MKKQNLLTVMVLLLVLLTQSHIIGYAQSGTPTPSGTPTMTPPLSLTPTQTPTVPEGEDFVSLAAMGMADRTLNGPYASVRVRFNQPSSWRLLPGAFLRLEMGAYFNVPESVNSKGALMTVSLNSVLLQSIVIDWQGERTVNVPIPLEALTPARLDGRHELALFLDASTDCRTNNQTTIMVRATSGFDLPHEVISPDTSLATLPFPFYQESTFLAEPVTLVLPRAASTEEMRAALTIVAAFGRFSQGKLVLPTITSDFPVEASVRDLMMQGHLIYVGKPAAFAELTQVKFPAPLDGQSVQTPGMQADDGVLEMAVSPWNVTRAVLYVGGNSDVGVVKAAQALSFGVLRVGSTPNLTLVSDVNASINAPLPSPDRTLQDLGLLKAEILAGYGFLSTEYQFFVPPGMVPGQDAYLDLMYVHSALLDFTRSGLVLSLNGSSIGSARFTDATSKSENTLRVGLPAYALRPGNNRLQVGADLVPVSYCSDLLTTGLWLSIAPTTLLHLPLVPAQTQVNILPPDLSRYPSPFTYDPTLANMIFLLAKDDPVGWDIAAKLAAELGKNATGEIINFGVYFADNLPEDIRAGKDMIVIGRATRLPLITELADKLPAPFPIGSDIAVERGMRVIYRLAEGVNLGYLQLLSSPWNEKNTILAVMGTTDLGLQWGGNALLDPRRRGQLDGNFAVANDLQVLTSDTRSTAGSINLSATAAPGALPTFVNPVQVQAVGRPVWVLPGAIGSGVLALLLVIYVLVSGRRKK
jgi:hypothetical protein